MKKMIFQFCGYSGFDIWLSIMPRSYQTRAVARKWVASQKKFSGVTPDLKLAPWIVQMPWGCFRVLSEDGDVEPSAYEPKQYY